MVNVGWGCSHAAGMVAPGLMLIASQRRRTWRVWDHLWHHTQTRSLAAQEQWRHFCKSNSTVGPLLGELEEFCATSLKTLLLLLKHSGLGTPSSPDTVAGATLAREQEQPSLSSLQQGKSYSPSSLQGHCQNGVLCWRKSPPCLDFLIHSGPAQSPVSPCAWVGKMSLMAGASHRGQSRMLGDLQRSRGSGFKGTPLYLKRFHVESSPPALLAPKCEKLCAVRKRLPNPLVKHPAPVAFRGHKVGSPSSPQGLGQTLLQLIYCSLLQEVVWGCGMTDLCRSSCRVKCLLVPCVFMFLKVLALIRLGLKIYFKVGTH